MPKQSNIRHKISKNTIEFVLCWSSAGNGNWPKVWFFIPIETLLEKTIFSFARNCQLEVAWLGMESSCPLASLSAVPLPAWTSADAMHVATVSMSSYVLQYRCVWKTLFAQCHPSPLALIIFLLSILYSSSLGPEGWIWWRHLFWTECSKVFHCLHFVQLWVSAFVPIYRWRNFSNDGWVRLWI